MCLTEQTSDAKMRSSRRENDLVKLMENSDSYRSVEKDAPSASTASTSTVADYCYCEDADVSIEFAVPEIPTPTKIKKNVSFGNLEELQFPVVEGDPNFEMAYPMTLGWDCWNESTVSIDEFEANRSSRRTSDQLRTMTEDRRKIIKDSKKQSKHRRRESISNGQIPMDPRRNSLPSLSSFLASLSTSGNPEPKAVESKPAEPKAPSRPGLRRQNSIGNGQISRDPRRNDTPAFLESSAAQVATADKSQAKLSEAKPSESKPSGRPGLRRQNSIGNGEIQKHKKRNSVQKFLKKMTRKQSKQ